MRAGIKTETGVDDDGNYINRLKITALRLAEEPEELILEVALIPRVIEEGLTE